MKRYEMPAIYALKESDNGSLVMYSEALQAMQSMVEFASKHVEEIEQGVGDFGDLTPLLAFMAKGKAASPTVRRDSEKKEVETGVLIMKDAKAWGEVYNDGNSQSNGWIEPIDAPIHNPKYCKKTTSVTYSGSPDEKHLETAVLVNAKRVTDITLEIGDEYDPLLDMVTLKKG